MKCFYHTDREAIATCQHCGKALCRECAAKYNPCLCDECKSILDAADRQAESDKRQKYLDALVDTRSEFIHACIAGVVVGLVFYSMFAGGADAGSRVTYFVLGFFVPFGWKLLTYLQSFIHSPQPRTEFRVEKRYFEENRAVWRALEDAQAAVKVRVIGVSNFLRDDLKNLLSACRVKPMVNQILLHNSNTDLVDYCKAQGIQVEAYSPIAHGEALKNPAIARMAEKYGVSAARLCIRYVIQLGAVALPKTADPRHMADNADADFIISDDDMDALKHMEHIADYGDFNVFPVFSGKPLA